MLAQKLEEGASVRDLSVTFGHSALKMKGYKIGKYYTNTDNKKQIYNFSSHSKKNLLFKLQTIDYDKLKKENYQVLFVTLTYQDKFFFKNKMMSDVKSDIDTFFKRLKRYYDSKNSEHFLFYKLEFTKRGVPHFHIFLVSTLKHTKSNYSDFMRFVSHSWVDVITRLIAVDDSDLCKMYNAGTNTRYVKTAKINIVFAYINKEIGKIIQTENNYGWVGRFWGISNRKFYNRCVMTFKFRFESKRHFFKFRRIMLNYMKSRGLNISGFKKSIQYSYLSGFTVFFLVDIRRFLIAFLDTQDSS